MKLANDRKSRDNQKLRKNAYTAYIWMHYLKYVHFTHHNSFYSRNI